MSKRKKKNEICVDVKGEWITVSNGDSETKMLVPRRDHTFGEVKKIMKHTRLGKSLIKKYGSFGKACHRLAALQLRTYFLNHAYNTARVDGLKKIKRALASDEGKRLLEMIKDFKKDEEN